MKKVLRSILTLCLSLIFVMTLCPCFSVMAATDLSTLTADDLAGTQAPTAITTNLTLPEIDGTWSSSNEAVISSTTGAVTRPLAKDAKVTLTATPGEGESVSFNFTVKAQIKNILASENFAGYTELENTNHDTNIFSSMTNWQNSTGTDSHIVQDTSSNKYLEVGFDKDGGDGIRWNISPTEKVVYFDVQFKRDTAGMPFNLQAYFSAEVNGETAQKLARLATIYDETNEGRVYWGNNGNSSYATYTLGEWHSLSFKIDMDNLKTYGSIDGGVWNEVDMLATYGGNFNTASSNTCTRDNTSINYMQRINFALNSGASTNVMLDNLVLSTDVELNAAQTLSLVSADDIAGNQAPTAITTNLTMPEHSGITWSSSNTAVISDGGVVTRPLAADAKVTMTATPTDGSGDPVTFNFIVKAQTKKVLASENFAAYTALTNENHDTNIFSSMTNWGNSTSTGSHILNNYLEVGFDKNPSSAHQIRWNISPSEKVVYFDIDFKRDEKGMPFNLQAYFSAQVGGSTEQKYARLATIYDGNIYWGNNANSSYTAYTLGSWHSLSFKIDMDNLKTYGSLDGGEWNEVDMLATYGGNFNTANSNTCTRDNTSINYMQRIHFALNSDSSTNVMLDNLVLSTDAFSITDVKCDATGKISAVLGNSGAESQNATVICAGYQGDKLIEVESQSIILLSGNNDVTFTKDFSDATTYSIYLWNSLDKLIPLCEAVSGKVVSE